MIKTNSLIQIGDHNNSISKVNSNSSFVTSNCSQFDQVKI